MAATPALASPVPPHSAYVAMGSSFAAGPWIGASADTPPNRCDRSAINYAHVLAGKLGLDLSDVTCSGAKAEHILNPWSELPPQVAAVTPQTRLVTITAGGNDLNYLGLVGAMECANWPDHDDGKRRPCPAATLPTAQDEARLSETLRAAITRIHAVAPQARVILVQYFTLFSPGKNCAKTGLNDTQIAELQTLATHLAAITAGAAHDTGAEVLPLDTASRSHGVCSGSPWVNGNNADRTRADGMFFHPNTTGMAAAAKRLARRVG
jgi:lysophospholipase L1-like esterase